jgi:hypothetical protein
VLCAALLALAAPAAAAVGLPLGAAAERSGRFAERTCEHDRSCVRHGVVSCRRQGRNVALCGIFDERDTAVQGRYLCRRTIRVALDPASGRIPVTGLGRWHC